MSRRAARRRLLPAAALMLALLSNAGAAAAFDPVVEATNFSKIGERELYVTSSPQFQARMAQQVAADAIQYPQIVVADPERDFNQHTCARRGLECAGDVRFYDWASEHDRRIVRPVLYTARNGATISGNVWATEAGPAKRPGVVITTGGLAPETLYWGFAATLASHGYVVLTYEVQGQGRSDTYGEGVDRMEGRSGGPQAFASGQPFYDGSEDALDFLLSTADDPYDPRPSCGNANGGVATDHSAKQERRVAAGLNAAHNPLWELVDAERIGIAGHSQGAGAASYVGQKDPRVDAIVAWDHLAEPVDPPAECPSDPASRTDAEITKPALGLAGDYHQPPEPYTSEPDPEAKNGPFAAYEAAGVDSMQINIRGGTHYEFSFMAGYATTYPFGTATRRGYDLVGWYTTAWFDRYLKCRAIRCKRRAEARLLSDRWRDDRLGGEVDPGGDANLFSFYLRSRYALRRAGGPMVGCGDMRAGCDSMTPDGRPADYDLHADAFRAGGAPSGEPVDCAGPAGDPEPGTPEWRARDANNIFCAKQRHADQALHPVSPLPASTEQEGVAPMALTDAYREPSRHDDRRFRFDEITITNRSGEEVAAEIYRPCAPGSCTDMPWGLRTFSPRYPAVVVLHGGGSRKELHWWSSQTLAEAGYMTVAYNGAADNRENAEDVLEWLFATPGKPTPAGEFNPHWRELDRKRVGLAGHSRGGQMASVLGQEDRRVRAIVSWDRGANLPLPERLDTPTLFFVGDFECQSSPICEPEPYLEPPGGEGPGERGKEYDLVRAAGIDSMKVSLRASTHLDWTLSEPAGNRYAEAVSVYYTLSWFDRYLKGPGSPRVARRAFKRLVAKRFDRYADRHNISQGIYDPAAAARSPADPYAGNVPYKIGGLPVADRFSFYFPSKCFIREPGGEGGRHVSEDMRSEGCPRSGR